MALSRELEVVEASAGTVAVTKSETVSCVAANAKLRRNSTTGNKRKRPVQAKLELLVLHPG